MMACTSRSFGKWTRWRMSWILETMIGSYGHLYHFSAFFFPFDIFQSLFAFYYSSFWRGATNFGRFSCFIFFPKVVATLVFQVLSLHPLHLIYPNLPNVLEFWVTRVPHLHSVDSPFPSLNIGQDGLRCLLHGSATYHWLGDCHV